MIQLDAFLDSLTALFLSAGPVAPILFVCLFVALSVVLFPSTPLSMMSGALFGPVFGSVYASIATLCAAAISFFVSRRLGEERVTNFLNKKFVNMDAYHRRLEHRGWAYVILLRLSVPIPLGVMNYLLGLTRISFSQFMIGTFVGTIPWIVMYTSLGDSLAVKNLRMAFLALGALAIFLVGARFVGKKIMEAKSFR